MNVKALVLFCCVASISAQFGGQFQNQNQNQGQFNGGGFSNGGFNGGGFNNGFNGGVGGFDNGGFGGLALQNTAFQNTALQKQGQAQGNSAAAGNAAAQGLGSATSINQAQHQANRDNTVSSGLSANTAQGTQGSQAGGAAQAGGSVDSAKLFQSNSGQQTRFQRFKRQFGLYGGFGSQSSSNANSLGGGSALFGQVGTNNNAFTRSDPYGATGLAAGNSFGTGQGVNIWQAANANSQYSGGFRRKRQIYGGYPGSFGGGYYSRPSYSNANANALGGGQAYYGQVATNNNAYTRSDPYGASGFAAGNTYGQGSGVSLFNAANTNAASGIFG